MLSYPHNRSTPLRHRNAPVAPSTAKRGKGKASSSSSSSAAATTFPSSVSALASPYAGITFTILGPADVARDLREMGVERITEEELREPNRHKDKVKEVYLDLLGACDGYAEKEFDQFDMPAARADERGGADRQAFVPAELQTAAWSDLAFFRAVQKLLYRCGCGEFCLADILRPDKGRLLRHLSAVISFVRLQEDLLPFLKQLCLQRDEINVTKEQYELELQETLSVLAALKAEEPENRQTSYELEREIQQLETKVKEANKQNSHLRTETEKLKKENDKLRYEVENAELSVKEEKDKLDKWVSQLVQSPERKKQAIEQKTQLLDVIKGEVGELERQLASDRSSVEARRNLLQELQDLKFDAMVDLAVEDQSAVETLRAAEAKLATADKEVLQKSSNVTNAEREYRRQEEHSAGEKKRRDLQSASALERSETVKNQLLSLEKERRQGMAQIERGEREVRELRGLLEEEQMQANEEVRCMMREYKTVERRWAERHSERTKALGITEIIIDENAPCA